MEFFVIAIVDILSHIIIVGANSLCLISDKILFSHIASHVASIIAMYSVEDKTIVFYFIDDQEIG